MLDTNLQQDTKAIIGDLAFKGKGLFSTTTDTVLKDLNKSIKVSRSLGMALSSK